MLEDKFITDFDKIVGKTIKAVFCHQSGKYIQFDDGMFIGFEAYWNNSDIEHIVPDKNDYPLLVKLGLMTEQERKDLREKAQRECKEHNDRLEKQLYEKLKAKYGN